jgi:hypothetical protein
MRANFLLIATGLVFTAIACALIVTLAVPKRMHWNLADRRSIADVGWPDFNQGSEFVTQGRRRVRIELPQRLILDEAVDFVSVARFGGFVSELDLHLAKGSESEICEKISKMIGDYNLELYGSRNGAHIALSKWQAAAFATSTFALFPIVFQKKVDSLPTNWC